MLHPAKISVFALFSILMHVAFAILFLEVTLSFPPPAVTELSLSILTRGGAQSEIVQSKAAWPMPRRTEPAFSAEKVLNGFDAETSEWTQFGLPDSSFFSPRETLAPHVEIAELAAETYTGTPEELFSQLPAESKTMPITDFALGPVVPEILESD